MGWCGDRRSLRWLRIEHDLDRTNLTKELGVRKSPAELRSKKHRPWTFLAALLLSIFLLVSRRTSAPRIVSGLGFSDPPADGTFGEMPSGWKVDSHIVFSTEKAKGIGEKFGGDITGVTNTVIRDGTRKLQINEIQCRTARRCGSDPKCVSQAAFEIRVTVCSGIPRCLNSCVERLNPVVSPLKPDTDCRFNRKRYDTVFSSTQHPLPRSNQWLGTRFSIYYLNWEASENKAAFELQIDDLSKQFEFSNKLTLKRTGFGSTETQWSFAPQAISSTEAITEEAIRYEFATMPTRVGVRYVHVLR